MQYRLHCVILYSVILHHVVKITSFHINDSRISLQALPLPSTEGTDRAYTACSNQKYWVTTTLNTQYVHLVVVVLFICTFCVFLLLFLRNFCVYIGDLLLLSLLAVFLSLSSSTWMSPSRTVTTVIIIISITIINNNNNNNHSYHYYNNYELFIPT